MSSVPREAYGSGVIQDEGLHVDIDKGPRCWRCRRKLGEIVARPWVLRCTRCKALSCSPDRAAQKLMAGIEEERERKQMPSRGRQST